MLAGGGAGGPAVEAVLDGAALIGAMLAAAGMGGGDAGAGGVEDRGCADAAAGVSGFTATGCWDRLGFPLPGARRYEGNADP